MQGKLAEAQADCARRLTDSIVLERASFFSSLQPAKKHRVPSRAVLAKCAHTNRQRPCPSRKPHPAFSGSKATLLPPRPLRTRRASFPAARSSLSNARLSGRDATTYDCCCVCTFFFANNARDGFHR